MVRNEEDGSRQMAEHKHGSMNSEVQEATYQGFIRVSIWVAAICLGILVILALFFS